MSRREDEKRVKMPNYFEALDKHVFNKTVLKRFVYLFSGNVIYEVSEFIKTYLRYAFSSEKHGKLLSIT